MESCGNESRPSELIIDEDFETDEDPSPYDSDDEEIDVDYFIKSLPRHINEWKLYKTDSCTLQKIGDGFFGEIYKVQLLTVVYNLPSVKVVETFHR